jgi:hypothetical protein
VTISRDQMVIVISHIVCDLTTLQVLLREVASVYSGACLPSVKRTYMDTSSWSNIAFPAILTSGPNTWRTHPSARMAVSRASQTGTHIADRHTCAKSPSTPIYAW